MQLFSVKNLSHKNTFPFLLLILLLINLLQTVYAAFTSGFIAYDDIEHLRASYFISNGDVPYRDFFEHHHPLLWYLLVPFIKFFPLDTLFSIYCGRIISLLISFLGGYYIYKIEKNFLGNKVCALICLNLYFWGIPHISSSALFSIKPDVYMRCCFFIGLYHLFCYLQNNHFKNLQICSLMFTLSFLFLQTAISAIAPLVLPLGYFLYKNPQRYKDLIKASVLPLLILALFIGILLYTNIWTTYWQTCWLLNSTYAKILQMPARYKNFLLLIEILIMATCTLLYYAHSHKFNIYNLSITILFIFELLIRLLFNPSNVRYLPFLLIYSAMLAAPFILIIIKKYKFLTSVFIFLSLLHTLTNILLSPYPNLTPEKYLKKTSGLTVMSAYYLPRQSYYWMYPLIEGVDNALFKRIPDYDINHMYQQNPPEIFIATNINTHNVWGIIRVLKLNRQQREILINHIPDIKKIGNYIEIEENIYQRQDDLK